MLGHVDRNGEPNANRSAPFSGAGFAAQNGSVDAYDFALNVHQCAAGVSRIDRRVSLDEVLNVFNGAFRPVQSADRAAGHREIEPIRIPEGHHDVTHV